MATSKIKWCRVHHSVEPCRHCARTAKIEGCDCGASESIAWLCEQMETAIRLGMSGDKQSLKLQLNRVAKRYPKFRKLAAEHFEPSDILREARSVNSIKRRQFV